MLSRPDTPSVGTQSSSSSSLAPLLPHQSSPILSSSQQVVAVTDAVISQSQTTLTRKAEEDADDSTRTLPLLPPLWTTSGNDDLDKLVSLLVLQHNERAAAEVSTSHPTCEETTVVDEVAYCDDFDFFVDDMSGKSLRTEDVLNARM